MIVNKFAIIPSDGGDWELYPTSEPFDTIDADYLVEVLREQREIGSNIYELGVDELPDKIDDIRGSIQHEPDRVFVTVSDDGVDYWGLVVNL